MSCFPSVYLLRVTYHLVLMLVRWLISLYLPFGSNALSYMAGT